MKLNAHLNFPGTCREAFDFYARVLDAKIEMAMTWAESPMGESCGPDMQDKIMHIALNTENMTLMGADAPAERFEKAAGIALSANAANADEARRLFDALSDGGTVTMPLQATFWSTAFGMTVDRFGIPWMVNADEMP